MKIMAINGSPRKNGNTAALLEKALEGAASLGADTEMIHLYDLDFKGCTSCFACKLKNGPSYGRCAMEDDLTPVLEKIGTCHALVLGSPVYFGDVTGEMRSFMERLFFPNLAYSRNYRTIFPGMLKTAFIYTMNVKEEAMKERGYDKWTEKNESLMKWFFGHCESLFSFNTLQFDDYSLYVSDMFDPEEKMEQHKKVFSLDLESSFELGKRLAQND
ncbi:MAG TPA: flavodoxin family protein [Synergistales bacterium]|nr:flavodoxin family protein [Synergistales bacterium]